MNGKEQSVGKQLRTARRAKNWSVERAAYATKLQPEVISQIESDRFDLLPNPAYARGFVRIYARELGLNVFQVLKRLNGVVDEFIEVPETLLPETLEALPPRSKRQTSYTQSVGLLIIMLITLTAFVLGGIQLYRIWPALVGSQKEPAPVAASSVDETEKEVRKEDGTEIRRAELVKKAAPVVSKTPSRLQITATEDCWVRVKAIRGEETVILYEDIIPIGATIPPVPAEAWAADSFEITARDAEKIHPILNDQNLGPHKEPGRQTFVLPES